MTPMRARRRLAINSLTSKNLAIFSAIFLVALAPLVYSYWADVRESRIKVLAVKLEAIAHQGARRIDVAALASLASPFLTNSDAHNGVIRVLARIQQENHVDNAVLVRREPGGNFTFIADGNDQFYITQPVFIFEQFPKIRAAAEAAWSNRWPIHSGLFGLGKFEYLQVYLPLQHRGRVVAMLMINQFAEDVVQAIREKALLLFALTGLLVIFGLVVFWALSRRMLAPLLQLKDAAMALSEGNLDVEIAPLRGRDEIAELNASFRAMVGDLRSSREALHENNEELKRALTRVQLMEDLEKNLSKFVPREVRRVLQSDPAVLEQGKTGKDVTVLFLDIQGSTLLTEAMDPRHIDQLIQTYFSRFVDTIYEYQGDITETAGDGLMIIFQGDDEVVHACNAVRAAMRIQQTTNDINATRPTDADNVLINIGINSGQALVGFTHLEGISGTRITFTATGRTTILAARLSDLARDGSVLIGHETMRRVERSAEDPMPECHFHSMGEVALKNIQAPEEVFRLDYLSDCSPAVVSG